MTQFVDQESLETNQTIEARILIIGGGPAGLALAMRLSELGIDYLVVESGDKLPGDAQRFTEGENSGLRLDDPDESRVRALGGTTHIWGGHTRILDPIDFAERSYIPYSGWPIDYAEFRKYGERALATLHLSDNWDSTVIGDHRSIWPDEQGSFQIETYKLSPVISTQGGEPKKGRWGNYFRHNSSRVKGRVLLNATVRRLEFGANGEVVSATCVTASGKPLTLKSDAYVVACGGLENARFLLINQESAESTLRDTSSIGKFFMEHPHHTFGMVKTIKKPSEAYRRVRAKDGGLWGWRFYVKDEVQEKLGLPNIQFRLIRKKKNKKKITKFELSSFCEQCPNPSSYVALNWNNRDELGDPRIVVHYDLYDWEYGRFYRAAQLLAVDMGAQGFGRVWLNSERPETYDKKSVYLGSGHHHMGTTRMGSTAEHSVVDKNLKVWGIQNLYVAGSSVFPTAGAVNPTVNLIMLSLRLGDHLAEV